MCNYRTHVPLSSSRRNSYSQLLVTCRIPPIAHYTQLKSALHDDTKIHALPGICIDCVFMVSRFEQNLSLPLASTSYYSAHSSCYHQPQAVSVPARLLNDIIMIVTKTHTCAADLFTIVTVCTLSRMYMYMYFFA